MSIQSNRIERQSRRVLLALAVAALLATPAARAQEERQQPQDAAASGSDMLQQSGVANPAQSALLSYGAGERDLERAAKLTEKLAELDGKKRESTEKKIAKAYESAQDSFREALGYDPRMLEAYVGLARALHAVDDHKGVLQVTTQGLRLDPKNEELFKGWAQSLLKLDLLGDSTQIYAKLKETNPDWAAFLMGEMKGWLEAHRADPGDIDQESIDKLADWIAEQEAAGG